MFYLIDQLLSFVRLVCSFRRYSEISKRSTTEKCIFSSWPPFGEIAGKRYRQTLNAKVVEISLLTNYVLKCQNQNPINKFF